MQSISKRITFKIFLLIIYVEYDFGFFSGMSSVEFLSLEDENAEWVEGPSMPRELMEFTLLTSPEEDGVLAIGGISGSTREAAIFKMTCTGSLNCEWTELEQTLDIGRSDHVAFLIPDELTSCE